MEMKDKTLITLVAIYTGEDELFNGKFSKSGVHLRWYYPRSIGPPKQVTLTKEISILDRTASDNGKNIILPVNLPPNVYADSSNGILSIYQQIQKSNIPVDTILLENTTKNEDRTDLYLIDLLQLLAIDPYIATMQGLYFTDKPTTKKTSYSITATWDEQKPYYNIALTKLHKSQIKNNILEKDIDYENNESIRIVNQQPDRYLEISFDRDVDSIKIETTANLKVLSSDFTINQDKNIIYREDKASFSTIYLTNEENIDWNIQSISYHLSLHKKIELTSNTVDIDTDILTPKPGSPILTEITTDTLPAVLDNTIGEVIPPRSRAHLWSYLFTHPDNPVKPIRQLIYRDDALLTKDIDNGGYPSPQIISHKKIDPILPSLIAWWSFDCSLKDFRNKKLLQFNEKEVYTKSTIFGKNRSVYEVNLKNSLKTIDRKSLNYKGVQFSIQILINPDKYQDENSATIIRSDEDNDGFYLWFGLVKNENNKYNLKFKLKNSEGSLSTIVTKEYLPTKLWSEVTLSYYKGKCTIYINDREIGLYLDNFHDFYDEQINFSQNNNFYIGENLKAKIADLKMWQESIHPKDAKRLIDKNRLKIINNPKLSPLVASWENMMIFEKGNNPIIQSLEPSLQSIGINFTIQLWVKITDDVYSNDIHPLIYNAKTSYMLSIKKYKKKYKIQLVLNNKTYSSNEEIEFNKWNHILINYDGKNISFYLNKNKDSVYPINQPAYANNKEILYIGQNPDNNTFCFANIAEVYIWRETLIPDEAFYRLASVQYIDNYIQEDGKYKYHLKGVDIFGRVSEESNYLSKKTKADVLLQPPTNVHAKFIDIIGDIKEVVINEDETLTIKFYMVDLKKAITENVDRDFSIVDMLNDSYDLPIYQTVFSKNEEPKTYMQNFYIQEFEELYPTTEDEPDFQARLKIPPFAQFLPTANDTMLLPYELVTKVEWVWTGMQRIFTPRAKSFKLHLNKGSLHTISGKVTKVYDISYRDGIFKILTDISYTSIKPNLTNVWCSIGSHIYKITEYSVSDSKLILFVNYHARPIVVPQLVDNIIINTNTKDICDKQSDFPSDWNTNKTYDIDISNKPELVYDSSIVVNLYTKNDTNLLPEWVPDEHIYKLSIPYNSIIYIAHTKSSFVSGALLAKIEDKWDAYNVVWEEIEDDKLILYIQNYNPNENNLDLPSIDIQSIKYYVGKKYEKSIVLPTKFDNSQATQEWVVALTTKDDENNESAISQKASVFAINRKKPPTPKRPEISIDPVDYYGNVKNHIKLNKANQVYRAMDTDIFLQDLELRRNKLGFYKDKIFADDADFDDWITYIEKNIQANINNNLFIKKTEKNLSLYDMVTDVWRRWADRFYRGLSDDELASLSERGGNESAFNLVNTKPVYEDEYIDTVKGTIKNKILYRTKTISQSAQTSDKMSPSTLPTVISHEQKINPPVIVAVNSGEREITIEWRHNGQCGDYSYELYKTKKSDEELQDLRYFGDDEDPRVIDITYAYSFCSKDHTLLLYNQADIESIEGVYIEAEFHEEENSSIENTKAYNYLKSVDLEEDDYSKLHKLNLRKIADNINMVVAYIDNQGEKKLLKAQKLFSYSDDRVAPQTDYYYLVAIRDKNGYITAQSTIQKAQAYDSAIIEPPELIVERFEGENKDTIHIYIIAYGVGDTVYLERQKEDGSWIKLTSMEVSDEEMVYVDENVNNRGKDVVYRAYIVSKTGLVSKIIEALSNNN